MDYNLTMALLFSALLGWLVLMSHLGARIMLAKGRDDMAGRALGVFLGPVGLLIALLLPARKRASLTGNARDDAAIAERFQQW